MTFFSSPFSSDDQTVETKSIKISLCNFVVVQNNQEYEGVRLHILTCPPVTGKSPQYLPLIMLGFEWIPQVEANVFCNSSLQTSGLKSPWCIPK